MIDLERLAREAGMTQAPGFSFTGVAMTEAVRRRFAQLVAEEAATMCDQMHSGGLTGLGGPGDANAEDCAAAIRDAFGIQER